MSVLALWEVKRDTDTGFEETVTVWARDPAEARSVAEKGGYAARTCDLLSSAAIYHGQPILIARSSETKCPDCALGSMEPGSGCRSCGLSWGAMEDAAAFMEEMAERERTLALETPDRDGVDF